MAVIRNSANSGSNDRFGIKRVLEIADGSPQGGVYATPYEIIDNRWPMRLLSERRSGAVSER